LHLGTARPAPPPPDVLRASERLAEEIARRAVTLLHNDRGLVPLLAPQRCVLVLTLTDGRDLQTGAPFVDRLREVLPLGASVTARTLPARAAPEAFDRAFALVEEHDVIVVPTFVRPRSWRG